MSAMTPATSQYVCLVRGYNMTGERPGTRPFRGAGRDRIITREECAKRFRVHATPVTESVMHLASRPALGFEHAAYRVETRGRRFWIDCPRAFDEVLDQVDVITFTHGISWARPTSTAISSGRGYGFMKRTPPMPWPGDFPLSGNFPALFPNPGWKLIMWAATRRASLSIWPDPCCSSVTFSSSAARASSSIPMAPGTDSPLALMSMDLGRFKVISDTLGHGEGDELLN